MKSILLRIIGFIFYIIGLFGYFIPGLPGTIFIILAAFCFLSGHPKYYNKIINNKNYGKIVKDFVEFQIIPYKIKIIILCCIWLFSLLSIFYFLYNQELIYRTLVLFLAFIGSVTIIKAKDNEQESIEFK